MKYNLKYTFFFLSLILLIDGGGKLFAQKAAVIKKVSFKGNFNLPQKELLKAAGIAPKRRFYRQQLPKSVAAVENYFTSNGYLFGRVDSVQTLYADDSSSVAVIFWVDGGRQTWWGNITLQSDSLDPAYYKKYIRDLQNSYYSEARLEEAINQILEAAADSGYPFAEADVGDVILRKEKKRNYADIDIHVHENHKTYLSNIIFDGNKNTKDYVMLRELGLRKGGLYSRKELDDALAVLRKMPILRSVDQPQLFKAEGDSVDVLIKVEESNSTNFDGVIGYMPGNPADENSKGYFTGTVNIAFNNLFGTARAFSVNWKKADTLSEEFHVRYLEPWIFNWPLNLALGLDRTVRDTLYIEWDYNFNLHTRLLKNLVLFTEVRQRSVTPDSAASFNNRLTSNDISDLQVGLQYDTRDYRLNPMSGLFYKASFTYGYKKINGPAYVIEEDSLQTRNEQQSYEMIFEFYQNIWKNQVLALKLTGMHISGSNIQMSDYFWFGGFRTIRGYRENQFFADKVAWANIEYRFLVGRNSRIFLFNDWGYYDNPQIEGDLLSGYGMGIRFETGLGILEVAYGLGKGDSFAEGKIHFGIINTF